MLESILSNHVLVTVLPSTIIPAESIMVSTLQGTSMTLARNGTTVTVNDIATVLESDILANNGILHFIDTVITDVDTWQPTVAPTARPTIFTTQPPVSATGQPTTAMPITATLQPIFLATNSPTSLPTPAASVRRFDFALPCIVFVFVCSVLL